MTVEFIKQIVEKNHMESKKSFDALISKKVFENLEEMKKGIASQIGEECECDEDDKDCECPEDEKDVAEAGTDGWVIVDKSKKVVVGRYKNRIKAKNAQAKKGQGFELMSSPHAADKGYN